MHHTAYRHMPAKKTKELRRLTRKKVFDLGLDDRYRGHPFIQMIVSLKTPTLEKLLSKRHSVDGRHNVIRFLGIKIKLKRRKHIQRCELRDLRAGIHQQQEEICRLQKTLDVYELSVAEAKWAKNYVSQQELGQTLADLSRWAWFSYGSRNTFFLLSDVAVTTQRSRHFLPPEFWLTYIAALYEVCYITRATELLHWYYEQYGFTDMWR